MKEKGGSERGEGERRGGRLEEGRELMLISPSTK